MTRETSTTWFDATWKGTVSPGDVRHERLPHEVRSLGIEALLDQLGHLRNCLDVEDWAVRSGVIGRVLTATIGPTWISPGMGISKVGQASKT
jgi:hypothetical protein